MCGLRGVRGACGVCGVCVVSGLCPTGPARLGSKSRRQAIKAPLTSPDIIANGTLVLQNNTAPHFLMIRVISDSSSFVAGSNAWVVYPIVASTPWIWKQSLSEMGRPCSGPTGTPDWA
jgi:hypothetical protein